MNTELQTNIAEEIDNLYQQANIEADTSKDHAERAIEFAWECGRKLNEQKEVIGHGKWLAWVGANCPNIKIRTAQNYMGLAAKYATLAYLKEAHSAKSFSADGLLTDKLGADGKPNEGGVSQADGGAVWVTKAAQYFNTHDLTKLDANDRQVWIGRLKPLADVYERLRAL